MVTMPDCCLSIPEKGAAISDLSNVQVGLFAQVKRHQQRLTLIGSSDAAAGRRSPIATQSSSHAPLISSLSSYASCKQTTLSADVAFSCWQSLNALSATHHRNHTVTQCAASRIQLERCSELNTERWDSLNNHMKNPT